MQKLTTLIKPRRSGADMLSDKLFVRNSDIKLKLFRIRFFEENRMNITVKTVIATDVIDALERLKKVVRLLSVDAVEFVESVDIKE